MIEPANLTVMLTVSNSDPDVVDVLIRDDSAEWSGQRRWYMTGESAPVSWGDVLDQVRIADLTLIEMVRRDALAVAP